MKPELTAVDKELIKKLKEIKDERNFVNGTFLYAETQEERKEILNFIKEHPEEATSTEITLMSLDFELKRKGKAMEQRIQIIKKSITDMDTDAIVNAANSALQAGGGVCGYIFRAAGYDELQAACNKIGHCDTGNAVITPGFRMKNKYIIHAVGPIYSGGNRGEAELLYGAYYNSLKRAQENGCKSVAFPLISAGIFGYPIKEAWEVAVKAVKDFQEKENADITVQFAVLDDDIMKIGENVID